MGRVTFWFGSSRARALHWTAETPNRAVTRPTNIRLWPKVFGISQILRRFRICTQIWPSYPQARVTSPNQYRGSDLSSRNSDWTRTNRTNIRTHHIIRSDTRKSVILGVRGLRVIWMAWNVQAKHSVNTFSETRQSRQNGTWDNRKAYVDVSKFLNPTRKAHENFLITRRGKYFFPTARNFRRGFAGSGELEFASAKQKFSDRAEFPTLKFWRCFC